MLEAGQLINSTRAEASSAPTNLRTGNEQTWLVGAELASALSNCLWNSIDD